jgi:signal transduction histidine kinase
VSKPFSFESGDWLAQLGHEIRSPLSSLLAFIDLLDTHELSPEDRSEYLKRMRASCRSLAELTNRVLDLSRLERDGTDVDWVPVPLRERILDALDGWSAEALCRSVSLRVEFEHGLPPSIETDPLKLWQVLNNLLSNALKFTPAGEVVVTAGVLDAGIFIEVRDTGIGITAEERPRLFIPFSRLSGAAGAPGTGLGLALSQGYCRALGGDLVLMDGPAERGCRFRVTLPLRVTTQPSDLKPLSSNSDKRA